MNVEKAMKATLATYLKSVQQTLSELSELEELAQVYSTVIQTNEAINLEIENSIREVSYLQSQRDEIFNEYHEATFSGNADKVAGVEADRDRINARLDELHQGITDARAKIVELDSSSVSEMLARYWSIELPVFSSDYILGYVKDASRSGLVEQLQDADNQLRDEIAASKGRINATNWVKYADENVLRDIAPKVADKYFGTLKAKQQHERFAETMKRAKQNRPNKQALLRSLDQVI